MFKIYSRPGCSYCDATKMLLERRRLPYQELILDTGQQRKPDATYYTKAELQQLVPNVKTVPQIFHNDKYIGGYADLTKYLGS